MTTERGEFWTNDDCRLVYEVAHGRRSSLSDSPVVLIHGWCGSRRYFDDSFASLQQTSNHPPLVIRYDLRGHGESEQPKWGHHVARYAADLRDLLFHLGLDNVTLVGASLGCAIIWSYFELFGGEGESVRLRGPGAPAEPRGGLAPWQQGVLRRGLSDASAGAPEVRLHGVHQRELQGLSQQSRRSRVRAAADGGDDEGGSGRALGAHGGPHALDWRPTLRTDRRAVSGARRSGSRRSSRWRASRRWGGSSRARARWCSSTRTTGCTSRTSAIPPTW